MGDGEGSDIHPMGDGVLGTASVLGDSGCMVKMCPKLSPRGTAKK